jgi:BlaI family transcriptional regulator, penicillinase repressor
MRDQLHDQLSRRERQIMDIIFRRRRASVAEVLEDLPDPPSYSSIRALMGILEDKGHLRHEKESYRYIYRPVLRRDAVGRSAMQRALQTFFGGSMEKAVAALLDVSATELSEEELGRIGDLIEAARKKEQ